MKTTSAEPGSFRDRDAKVFYAGDEVYRALGPRALAAWREVSQARFFNDAVTRGQVVATCLLDDQSVTLPPCAGGQWAGALWHERVEFISYPYEWSFGMLRAAALLQLELLESALREGFVLRDATPYNLQWRGAQPVFIDVTSFAPLPPGEPWVAYRQFCQLFLYPLMLTAYRGVDFRPLLRGALDGIEPGTCWRLLGWRDLLRSGVLLHVALQSGLSQPAAAGKRSVRRELHDVGFSRELILRNVVGLRRIVERLRFAPSRSTWSEYCDERSYSDADLAAKRELVSSVLAGREWGSVWDLGCNTGEFSLLAAEHARQVIAIDGDALAIDRLYHRLAAGADGQQRVLPLVIDFANPSPGLGWRGLERLPLEARGRPGLVLALALLHHLVLGANLPLDEVVAWLASLGEHLVIEFVGRADPMVARLLLERDDLFYDYDPAFFERCLEEHCEILQTRALPGGTRTLYFARVRGSAARSSAAR